VDPRTRSERALQPIDVVALRRDEQVEVLGEPCQPAQIQRHRAEDDVAYAFPLKRGQHLLDRIVVYARYDYTPRRHGEPVSLFSTREKGTCRNVEVPTPSENPAPHLVKRRVEGNSHREPRDRDGNQVSIEHRLDELSSVLSPVRTWLAQ